MNDKKERVLSFVSRYGPILPVQVSKEIGSDIIFAGAVLSEMISNKKVLVTSTKRDGSPFYYAPGQESKLQDLSKYLVSKEKEAFDLLKENRIIRDSSAEPAIRVALRFIKDFAVPLDVNIGGKVERFWKWYLLDEGEAKSIIGGMLDDKKPKEEVVEEDKIDKKEVPKKEIKKKIVKEKPIVEKGRFHIDVNSYFNNNKIEVIGQEIVRKDKEINLIVKIPSNVGELSFYVKAKNKKTVSNVDLMMAYSEGQKRNMPVLFLSNGRLTKKSEEYIKKELTGQVVFKSI